MSYPFETILVNQREITIKDILSGDTQPLCEFETSTLDFIHSWLKGQTNFNIQTSGSTGNAKQITITREQMQRSAQRTIRAIGLNDGDTALVCLNTNYIAGKMMVVRAFEGNMKIIVADPSANPFENLKADQPIDFMAVVPLQLQTVLSKSAYFERLNKMKAILVGGASVSEKLKEEVQAIPCPVYATYGMTETISHIALQLLNTNLQADCFHALPGVVLKTDNRGCLVVEDEILTTPISTNDLVEIKESGKFKWVGRIDNVINTGGIKVNPEKVEKEIEHIASQQNVDLKFFIAGLPHQTLGEQVTLIVEGTPLSAGIEKALLETLAQQVSTYETPKEIIYAPLFSLTETGKINRTQTIRSLANS